MGLPNVTRTQIVAVLHELGLHPGDGVMVHAALQYLGQPEGGAEMYLDALDEVLGLSEQGTLVAPALNFGFAHDKPFDQLETPSEGMGILAELVRQHPGARRGRHPLQSVAAIGRYAADLSSRDTSSAFDPGSAFERMLELDFKLLLLGAGVEFTTMIHYAEQQVGVPYRYWKEFSGLVRLLDENGQMGEWQTRTYRMYARDLAIDPHVHSGPVQAVLQRAGLWNEMPLNFGKVCTCRFVDFVQAAEELLRADPWALVQNRP
jgi:aminoglycoside 3-N-acetyltransferase